MCQNIFKISRLFSINYSYFVFSNVMLFYVTVPNFFPIYCYFMSTIPPPTTGAVKTLPLHTPTSLVLKKFFPNEFPIQFLRTNQIFFQFQQYKTDLHAIFQFMFFHFSLYIFSNTTTIAKPVLTHHKHHRLFRSWHNATTKFNHHNIHNSFGNSVIQSAYQPSVYSRLN